MNHSFPLLCSASGRTFDHANNLDTPGIIGIQARAEEDSMDALVLHQSNETFRRMIVDRPTPRAGQVLVRVKASGVNPLDLKIKSGKAPHARHQLPAILGMDIAGTVERVGPGVAGFQIGDDVFGFTGGVGGLQGSLATFSAVDAQLLALKPANLSMREAAALPLNFITAWEGLVDHAQVNARHQVLVQGAGGVGLMVIQIARAFGAEVFAADRPKKRPHIEELGGTAIDFTRTTVDEYVTDYTGGRGFDIVYDTVGGDALDASFRAVRSSGHVVSCLGWGTHSLAPLSFRAATYSGVFTLLPILTGQGRARHGEILRKAKRLAESDRLRPIVDPRRFNFATIEDAYRATKSGDASGKIVVDVQI